MSLPALHGWASGATLVTAALLGAIALLHAAWGLGLRWPARDERGLVALVVGARGRTRLPSRSQCFVAAAAILAAALIAFGLGRAGSANMAWLSAAGVIGVLVFAARGIAAYTPAWRHAFPQQPFARNDRRFYAPLCLCFAGAFALALLDRWQGG